MASFTNQIGYLTGDKTKNQASVIVEALKNGVKESPKNEAQILIKSDRIEVIISTSYMDFSNQLENVKFALRDYKYEMQIL